MFSFQMVLKRIKAPSTCCIENAVYNSLVGEGAPFKVQNKAIKFIILSDCIVLYCMCSLGVFHFL